MGSMALRLAEVYPPKTTATQSDWTSFCAFSAKMVGSDAPSSPIRSSCLPSTPPEALISSTASMMASRMTVSLTARPPDSELIEPTFTVSPDVSAQPSPAAEGSSPARAPHPAANSVAVAIAVTVNRRLTPREGVHVLTMRC